MSYLDTERPYVMAHRGFSLDGLENTVTAFRAALDLGVRHLETDVHATADGRLIAFHDDELDRVTDLTGKVGSLTWSTIKRARIAGQEPIPLFENLLEEFPEARFNVDIKSLRAATPFLNAIARTNTYHRVCVASFSDVRRRAVTRRSPVPMASSPGMSQVAAFWAGVRFDRPALRRAAVRDVVCLQLPQRSGPMVVDERFVATAHDEGLQVHVWTINEPEQMRKLLDIGVDCLITDRTDLAVDEVRARA